jgi:ubiquinone/menaquinone biosynthesis C-methylase UbiE
MILTLVCSILIFCICIFHALYRKYDQVLEKYFRHRGHILYDFYLKHFIQVVSEDNYFMNYGLWNNAAELRGANQALVDAMFEKTGLRGDSEKKEVLDVGCGYGRQDLSWIQRLPASCKLTAIDISEEQIQSAKEAAKPYPNLRFQQGDALQLESQFAKDSFDVALCLESAFHYPGRKRFFSSAHMLLKPGGRLVICDIVLNERRPTGFLANIFLRIFSDFLQIPEENLVPVSKWRFDLKEAGFEIIETEDWTTQTFLPYYHHFFYTWMCKKGLPEWLASAAYFFFSITQPFSYCMAVCEKKADEVV